MGAEDSFRSSTTFKRATTIMTDAAEAKPKPAKAKKKQAKPTHPPYGVMVVAAIKALKQRKGSSKRAILKYIQANYKVGDQASLRLNIALRKLGKAGKLKLVEGVGARGSFRIPSAPKGTGKGRGRPKGAKNKKGTKKPAKKATAKKKAGAKKGKGGRPKGAKNKRRKPAKKAGAKKGGRPKGAKNKPKAAKE